MEKFCIQALLMIHHRNFYIWGLILGFISFFSCQTEDCISLFNNDLLVDFIQVDTLENGTIVTSRIDTTFYEIRAVDNDSLLYSLKNTSTTLNLPVNPAADQTTFEFYTIASIRYDTISQNPIDVDTIYTVNPEPHNLSVSYRRVSRIVTEPCGVEIAFVSLEVNETSFELTRTVRDRLSRFNEVNIEVLF